MSHFWIIVILAAILFPALCRGLVIGAFKVALAIPFIVLAIFIVYEAEQGNPDAVVLLAIPAVMLWLGAFIRARDAERIEKKNEENEVRWEKNRRWMAENYPDYRDPIKDKDLF